MKVCLLTRRPVLDSGGIGRVSIELHKGLAKRGNNTQMVSASKVDLAHYFKYSFIDNLFQMPKGYDVYHAITPMESIWIPKDKGIATILDIIPITHPELHGARLAGNRVKYTIARICFTIGCRQAAKCRYIVCISDHVRQEFIEHFDVDENKVKVIKLGIRSDLVPKTKRDKIFRVGYLGQLDRRKRVDLFVTAFMGSNIDGELVLGGKGIDEQGIQELARGDSRIKFLGFIPDDKLVEFYNSLDVFIFPTAIEGYGLPPVEAMACKIPVVVLEDALMPWEVKQRCIRVQNLDDIFCNPGYLQCLCRGIDIEDNYKWAKSHNWDTTIEEYIKLYKEVLS